MTLDIQNLINDEMEQFEKWSQVDEVGYSNKQLVMERVRAMIENCVNEMEVDALAAGAVIRDSRIAEFNYPA